MRLLTVLVLLFLVFGGFLIVRYNNYKLDHPSDVVSFAKDYGKWLFGVGKSVSNVVGAAVKEQWLPENASATNASAINQTNSSWQKVKVIYK